MAECSSSVVFSLNVSGFSLTPYLESFTPTFGLGTPVFQRISSNLHCGTPTFSKRCLWDSYFQNPSENPDVLLKKGDSSRNIVRNSIRKRSTKNSWYDLFEEVAQQIDESPDIPSSVWNDFEKLASISVSSSQNG